VTRLPEPPAVGGVPASIAAIMAAIRDEVVATAPNAVHPIPGVPTTDGRLEEVPFRATPIAGVPTTGGPSLPADIDATVREMLTPLLKTWLDAHMPEIVETAVHAEIKRLTGQG
jgi:hypothetical protein